MNKVYITGDIHGNPFRFSSDNFPEGKSLTKDDFVIIAGDFGIIWSNVQNNSETHNLKWLREKPWTTLFIDGNHENHYRLSLLTEKEMFGGTVGEVCDSVYHLKRGEIYTICDKKFFCFGGAYSWDREGRTIGTTYWEEEVPNYQEMDYGLVNLESHQYDVDYIITHTLPKCLIPTLGFSKQPDGKEDPTCKYFDHIENSATFKQWYFGHMHVDRNMGKFIALYEEIKRII